MKHVGPTSAILLVLSTVAVLPASAASTNNRLHGSFGYSFSGSFGTGLASQIVETGVFDADGRGNLTATGKTVINGAVEEDATYECTYEVKADDAIDFDCVRTSDSGVTNPTFFGVLDDRRKELRFQARPSAAPFDVVNVAGTARKQ